MRYIKNRMHLLILVIGSLVLSVNAFADSLNVEHTGSMSFITDLDIDRKIITLGSYKIAFNSSTEIYDFSGNRSSVKALRKGLMISFEYDRSARFISAPVTRKIWIKSRQVISRKK